MKLEMSRRSSLNRAPKLRCSPAPDGIGSAICARSRASCADTCIAAKSGRNIGVLFRVQHAPHDVVLIHQQTAVAHVERLAISHGRLERFPTHVESTARSPLQTVRDGLHGDSHAAGRNACRESLSLRASLLENVRERNDLCADLRERLATMLEGRLELRFEQLAQRPIILQVRPHAGKDPIEYFALLHCPSRSPLSPARW